MLTTRQAITWTNAEPVHWSIYVAQGGDELNITDKNIKYLGLLFTKHWNFLPLGL